MKNTIHRFSENHRGTTPVDSGHVSPDVSMLPEGASAHATLKRLLAGVQPNVVHHVPRPRRLVVAKPAEERGGLRQGRVSLPNADNAFSPQLDSLSRITIREDLETVKKRGKGLPYVPRTRNKLLARCRRGRGEGKESQQ
jgi:hypothetical protein